MIRVLALTAAIATLAACVSTPDPEIWEDDMAFGEWYGDSNVQGRLAGDLPVVGSISDDLSYGYMYSDRHYVEFDLHVLQPDGDWAMIGGGFEPRALQNGDEAVLGEWDHWVFGCSGPSEWNAEFDESAEEVRVRRDIIEVDGVELVEFTLTASFYERGEVTATIVKPAVQGGNSD